MVGKFSVVIPALNDDEALARIVPRLSAYEVIIAWQPGLAQAVYKALQRASGDRVAIMDCDGYHPPELLSEMFSLLDNYDLVHGVRLFWPRGLHGAASMLANELGQATLGLNTQDITGGFCVAWRQQLLTLPSHIWQGYGDYNLALLYEAEKRHWRIHNYKYIASQRTVGQAHTKVVRHSLQYLLRIASIKQRAAKEGLLHYVKQEQEQ